MTSISDELQWVDGVGQAELVARREVKPQELVEAAIARIDQLDPGLNAVIIREFERGLAAAGEARAGQPFGGVPFLLKDLAVEWKGVRFTEASRFLVGNVSQHDQELTVRLRRAGVVLLGKTNTCEFGLLPTCEPVLYGPTANPWDPSRTPGGSSGGSAAAVAAGLVPMAYGNDAGGSIRFPASCCGLFALKPTRARLPLGPEYGDIFSGMVVEHALTRTVRDSAALLDATAGPDLGDPYWAPPSARPYRDEVGAEPGRLRIAFTTARPDRGPVDGDCVTAVREAMSLCEALGHEVMERELPGLDDQVYAAGAVMDGAAVAWILDYWVRKLGREPEPHEIEPLTRAFVDAGRSVTASQYLLAVQDLQRFGRTVARFSTEVDVWAAPTLSQPPVPTGHICGGSEDVDETLRRMNEFLGFPGWVANVIGTPAMSVPLHWTADGLPIGVSFMGRFGDEATLLRLAAQLEQARPWQQRTPELANLRAVRPVDTAVPERSPDPAPMPLA